MVEIVNDQPAYKVRFLSQETLATKGLLFLNFSATKKLKANGVAKKYISGIMGNYGSGICQQVHPSKQEVTNATCTSPPKVFKNF